MIGFIFKKVINVLKQKPIKLWGLTLLAALLTFLAGLFGFLPIISMPIAWAIEAGMALMLLNAYRKLTEPETDDLFVAFKSNFLRIVGGMAWMNLWIFIWALVPIAGVVLAIIKTYEYRFTPYILMTEPEVSATGALKKSMQMTRGFKGKMFGADMAIFGIIFGASFVLGLLSAIPYIGVLFGIVSFLLYIVVGAFSPIFKGLVSAAFYEEVSTMTPEKYASFSKPAYVPVAPAAPQPQVPTKTCANCGAVVPADAKFCNKCGSPLQ